MPSVETYTAYHTSAHVKTSQRPSDARMRNSKFFSTRKYLKSGLEMTWADTIALITHYSLLEGVYTSPDLLVVCPDSSVTALVER